MTGYAWRWEDLGSYIFPISIPPVHFSCSLKSHNRLLLEMHSIQNDRMALSQVVGAWNAHSMIEIAISFEITTANLSNGIPNRNIIIWPLRTK